MRDERIQNIAKKKKKLNLVGGCKLKNYNTTFEKPVTFTSGAGVW